jgi:hypothetical protein
MTKDSSMEKPIFVLTADSAKLPPKKLAEILFTPNSRIVGDSSAFKKQFPAAYEAAKASLTAGGRGISSPHDPLREARAGWNAQTQPRTYTEQTLLAQAKWPREEAAKPMPVGLEKDQVRYLERELARASYGMHSSRSVAEWQQRLTEASRVPETKVEQTYTVPRDAVEKLGMDPNERLSLDSFNNCISALVKLEQAEKAAAVSAKAAAVIAEEDKVAE